MPFSSRSVLVGCGCDGEIGFGVIKESSVTGGLSGGVAGLVGLGVGLGVGFGGSSGDSTVIVLGG